MLNKLKISDVMESLKKFAEAYGDVEVKLADARHPSEINSQCVSVGVVHLPDEVPYLFFMGSTESVEMRIAEEEGKDVQMANMLDVLDEELDIEQTEDAARVEAWGYLYEQARGMGSDSLAEYYADHEITQYDKDGIDELVRKAREN